MSLFYIIYTEQRRVGEQKSLEKREQVHIDHEKAEF